MASFAVRLVAVMRIALPPTTAMVGFSFAESAVPTPAVNVGVLRRELMAANAMSLPRVPCSRSVASQIVVTDRCWGQVVVVDAVPTITEMVDSQSCRDQTNKLFVNDPVNGDMSASRESNLTVAISGGREGTQNASVWTGDSPIQHSLPCRTRSLHSSPSSVHLLGSFFEYPSRSSSVTGAFAAIQPALGLGSSCPTSR